MKYLIIISIILVCIFLYSSEPQITFKPFKIKLTNIGSAIGWTLMIMGLNILLASERNKSTEKGFEQGLEEAIKILKEN